MSFIIRRYNMFKYIRKILWIVLIFCFNDSQIFADEVPEIKLLISSEFTLPVVLDQEKAIENIDIDITGYDPTVLELKDVILTGGILEDSNYKLLYDILDNTAIRIMIYAQSTLITGKGNILFLNFTVKGKGSGTLSFKKFICNELSADGGFYLNDNIFQSVKISVNNAPVANDGVMTTDEDTEKSGILIAVDADNDSLIYNIVTDGGKGKAVITDKNTGEFLYKPDVNQNGTDVLTFKVNDGMS